MRCHASGDVEKDRGLLSTGGADRDPRLLGAEQVPESDGGEEGALAVPSREQDQALAAIAEDLADDAELEGLEVEAEDLGAKRLKR